MGESGETFSNSFFFNKPRLEKMLKKIMKQILTTVLILRGESKNNKRHFIFKNKRIILYNLMY